MSARAASPAPRAPASRAPAVARVLRHVPFVRALALTGSLAADDARESADVDLLVIAAPGRLATTFLLMGPASTVLSRRLFCPNYYISEERLAWRRPTLRGPRAGPVTVPRRLGRGPPGSNPWLAEAFPNAPRPDGGLPAGGRLQRMLERPLRGALGDAVERGAARVARWRLSAHYEGAGKQVPGEVVAALDAGVSLRFHGLHESADMTARVAARREQVAAMAADLSVATKDESSATTS